MAWIARTTDPNGKQRNALTDGVYRREFVSVEAMTTTREAFSLETKVLPWLVWRDQLVDARHLTLADLPASPSVEEIVGATTDALEALIDQLTGMPVDGKTADGHDARQLLLDLLGAA